MGNKLKIASFNINSFRGYPQGENKGMEPIAEIIKSHMPDIVGLNEVSSGPSFGEQPKELADITEYPHHFYAPILELPGRHYGNAILSKYPIKHAEMIPIPDPLVKDEDAYYETRCILKAEIDVCGGITVLVSHFGLANSEKKNAVKTVIDVIGENPEKTVLMGDFNVRPDEDFLNPIKSILKDTADGFDEAELLSYPSDGGDRKIDYIFVSKDFVVSDTLVVNKAASDHKMIKTEISLAWE